MLEFAQDTKGLAIATPSVHIVSKRKSFEKGNMTALIAVLIVAVVIAVEVYLLNRYLPGSGGSNQPPVTNPLPGIGEPRKHEEDGGALALYRFCAVAFNVVAVMTLVGLLVATWSSSDGVQSPKQTWAYAWVLTKFLLLAVTTAASIRWYIWYTKESLLKVPENRLAILLIFGKYVDDLEPGLVYAPLWISDVEHVTTEQVESDLPADPKKIYHGDPNEKKDGRTGDGKIPDKFTPALRITLAQKTAEAGSFSIRYEVRKWTEGWNTQKEAVVVENLPGDSSLLKAQTVEVELSYAFRVVDLLVMYKTVGDLNKAKKIMDDHAIAGVTSELQRLCPLEVNYLAKEVAQNIMHDLTALTRDWGIEVVLTRLKPISFSHEFNTALMQAAQALEIKRKKITDAEGNRQARILEGEGEGEYRKATLTGEAEGQRKLVAAASADGGRTLAIKTIGDALGKSTLIATDPANLLGAVAGVGTVLKELDRSKPLVVLTDGDEGTSTTSEDRPKKGGEKKGGKK